VIVFHERMVWYNQPRNPTRGIRFPAGTYRLEAEDDEYRYFRAPSDVEYRIFRDGRAVDGRFMPGGLFLGKTIWKAVPAGAYLSVDPTTKVATWNLGRNFLKLEGKLWGRKEQR
jgi:hypothetical protein